MKTFIVIPHWNGVKLLEESLQSLEKQTVPAEIIVVDNGSSDGSQEMVRTKFPQVILIELPKNKGFAGGVNAGIRRALKDKAEYIALFNNDAVAELDWLELLIKAAEKHDDAGSVTGKFMQWDREHFDSTGDYFTIWGFSHPRGRDEKDVGQYDQPEYIFSCTGGASLYRAEMLNQVGLFDEEFFAYYEDVDLGFRAQLGGWKAFYEPKAKSYHHRGATSSRIGWFARYHSVKNFYYLYFKNMPGWLFWRYLPLFIFSAVAMIGNAVRLLQFKPLLMGYGRLITQVIPTLIKRRRIQRSRTVSSAYINSIIGHELPPTQKRLLGFRKRLLGR